MKPLTDRLKETVFFYTRITRIHANYTKGYTNYTNAKIYTNLYLTEFTLAFSSRQLRLIFIQILLYETYSTHGCFYSDAELQNHARAIKHGSLRQ